MTPDVSNTVSNAPRRIGPDVAVLGDRALTTDLHENESNRTRPDGADTSVPALIG